jgi:hypothetical protein
VREEQSDQPFTLTDRPTVAAHHIEQEAVLGVVDENG